MNIKQNKQKVTDMGLFSPLYPNIVKSTDISFTDGEG